MYVPGSELGTGDIEANKGNIMTVLMELRM
jgi:hypothetical protein